MLTVATQAQTNVWIGPAVGGWDDPANWSLGVVPNDQAADPIQVRIDANAGQDSSVLLESTVSIGPLTLDAADSLTITPIATLWSGSIENSGTIYATSAGSSPQTGLRVNGAVSNLPDGLLTLDQAAVVAFGPSYGLFRNQGVVEGSGILSQPFLWNEQRIDANVSGQSLQLDLDYGTSDFSSTQLTNSGTLRASNEGTLDISRQDFGPFAIQNQNLGVPGTIEALGDSTVLIGGINNSFFGGNTSIYGGRITTSAEGGVQEGQVQFFGSVSLVGVELDAQVSFGQNMRLVESTFLNRRSISISQGSTDLIGTNIISGGGSIELRDNASLLGAGGSPSQSFAKLVNVDNTIGVKSSGFSKSGTLGDNLLVENRGVVEADGQGANLTLRLFGPNGLSFGTPAWTNTGEIRAINGGRVVFGNTDERFLENTDGVIEVDENSTLSFTRTRIRGGIVRGHSSTLPIPSRFSGEATLENVRLEGVINWQADLTLAGNIENTGTLKSDQGLQLSLGSEEVFLTGGGELSVDRVEREQFFDSHTKLINVDNTIHLKNGGTDFEGVAFVNRGTVEANGTNQGMTYSPRSTELGMMNSGVIRAINGASLTIDSGEYREIQNYEIDEQGNVLPGTIQAGADSEVRLRAVSGGIVQAAAGGVIRVENNGYLGSSNTPTEIQLLGRIEAENLNLAGTIRNEGQLVLTGDIFNFSSSSAPSSPVSLLGHGELQLEGTLLTRNSTFLNGPNHTIVGSGDIITEGSFFTNEGRIEANDTNTLTITHTGPDFLFQQRGELVSSGNGTLNVEFEGLFTNRGTVRVAAGATSHFIGNLSSSNHQLVNAIGAEIVVDGQLFAKNSDLINEVGATVRGDGQIELVAEPLLDPRLINHGTLAPGDFVGQLTIVGDFEQTATGNLEIELGGIDNSDPNNLQFDHLIVDGMADLGGTLQLKLVDLGEGLFVPEVGDSFPFFTGGFISTFDSFDLPELSEGLAWQLNPGNATIFLSVVAVSSVDLDNDGDVDGNDFLLIQQSDPSLIAQWQAEYGSRVISSPASSQAVPEPYSCSMVLWGTMWFLLRRRS